MTIEEIQGKIEEIKSAIDSKNYSIDYSSANNISQCTAPDGSEFYVVYDMDGPRSSTDFGSNTITIAGKSFTCELEWGEWDSSFFKEIFDAYEEVEDGEETASKIIGEIEDMLSEVDGFLAGEYTDLDSQISAYEVMNHCSVDEYYWCEDDDKPMDVDDFTPVEDACDETMEFEGTEYYIVQETDEGDGYIAVEEGSEPDRNGRYGTVKLLTAGDVVVNVEDNDNLFDSTAGELE